MSQWRIERNQKHHFAVVRDMPEGKEFRCSASGKPSSFKTWAGAQYALRELSRAEADRAVLRSMVEEIEQRGSLDELRSEHYYTLKADLHMLERA